MDNRYFQILESLKDHEYRTQYIDEHINIGIAFQISGIREKQVLTQKELAEKLGIKQPLISAWENPNYGKYTLNTLKDLAKAFDVGLLVRFVPFSKMVNWTVNVTPDDIAPLSFDKEFPEFLIQEISSYLKEFGHADTSGDSGAYNIPVPKDKQEQVVIPSTSTANSTTELIYA